MDKVDNVDRKEYLLRELSKEKGVFPLSVFDMGELPVNITNELSKFQTKWVMSNKHGPTETLYEHKAGFYIYNKKGQQWSEVSIFYEIPLHNEVQFFINRLMKLIK